MHLFRIIRFFRLFRRLVALHGIIRLSVVKGEGQPTRCGHTLTRGSLPEGVVPLTLPQESMPLRN